MMTTKTIDIEESEVITLPTIDEFFDGKRKNNNICSKLFKNEGRFIFDLIMSPDSFMKAKSATENSLPAVTGIAEDCYNAYEKQKANNPEFNKKYGKRWVHVAQCIGIAVCELMEKNNYRKTGRKGKVPHKKFVAAEIYEKIKLPELINGRVQNITSNLLQFSKNLKADPSAPIISYRNPEAVGTFLTKHPEINDFIDSACPILANYFGKPVKIILELMYYPDGPEYQDLVGWIQSTDDVIVGLDKLEKFEDEWYLDNMDKVNNKFDFSLETR